MSEIIVDLRSLQFVEGPPLRSTCGENGDAQRTLSAQVILRHERGILWLEISWRSFLAVRSSRCLFEAALLRHAPSPEVTAHSTRLSSGPPASATGCTRGHSKRGGSGIWRGG